MNMTLAELRAVADELAGKLAATVVQEVRQPSPTAVTLALRAPAKTHHLLAEIAASEARVHLISTRSGTLDPPPPFVAKLRKELARGRVGRVVMPWDDRVLVMEFETRGGLRSLIGEFSGHHPNLFLTGPDFRILLALRPASSHKRSLVPGALYEPPPKPEGTCFAAATNPGSRLEPGMSPSLQLERLYEEEASLRSFGQGREALGVALRRRLKRTRRTLKKVVGDLERAEECDGFRRKGELLKMNFHRVRKGMTEIVVDDTLFGGGETTIELEARLGPAENLAALFKRYKKGSRAIPVIGARRRHVADEARRLEELLEAVSSASSNTEVEEVRGRVEELFPGLAPGPEAPGPSRRPRAVHSPYRQFESATGRPVLVGKGGKDNHQLTFQAASPHDVWMHVRGFSGSHVVIPLSRGQEPDHETLLDAAHLAVRFSKAPERGFTEVMWTRRKHVRAVRKGRPGQVTVTQERNLSFDVDEARLQRVLASAARPPAG